MPPLRPDDCHWDPERARTGRPATKGSKSPGVVPRWPATPAALTQVFVPARTRSVHVDRIARPLALRVMAGCRQHADGTAGLHPAPDPPNTPAHLHWCQEQTDPALISELAVEAPISTCTTERCEPLKCLGSQLQGKLTCGKLSTECSSLSGI